jgi:hypothetical protein
MKDRKPPPLKLSAAEQAEHDRHYGESVPVSLTRLASMLEQRAEQVGGADAAVHEFVEWLMASRPGYYTDADGDRLRIEGEARFASSWARAGRPTYILSHSVAALLAATRAPPISSDRLPHRALLIKVPREFLPLEGSFESPDSWLEVQSFRDESGVRGVAVLAVADSDTLCIPVLLADEGCQNEEAAFGRATDRFMKLGLHASRIARNAIAFISSHRECVSKQFSVSKRNAQTFTVGAPNNVSISREFRDAVVALCSDPGFSGAKRVLAHMVRGHWRNQACGEKRAERKMIWVQPHMRGDESLGRVVERIERISEIVN